MAADNKCLGEFVLEGLAPAPKGHAKIETNFSIDANGILHVTAVDKGTGKSQSVTFQSSGRVSDSEIDRMVK
jgi:molecular chaperone DnaK